LGGLPTDVLLMDIAAAQDLLGARGRLDHIDLDLSRIADARAHLERIQQRLGPDFRVRDLEVEAVGRRELSRAFETSLTALSLMSLLVGMFLVYNTTDFLLVQRNPVFQRLVALGAEPRALFTAMMLESLVLGAIASAVGVLGGILLARGLLNLVSQTMQGFYLAAGAEALQFSPSLLAAGWLAGSFATLLAGLPAAVRAARIAPRHRGDFAPRHNQHETPQRASLCGYRTHRRCGPSMAGRGPPLAGFHDAQFGAARHCPAHSTNRSTDFRQTRAPTVAF
jgi:putative ABC transport system permease protein